MQAKKVKTKTLWPDGVEYKTRYFNEELGDEEIKETIISQAKETYTPRPEKIEFTGLADVAEELGEDFMRDGGEYHTYEKWKSIMNYRARTATQAAEA